MSRIEQALRELPPPRRYAAIGGVVLGFVGGIVGLVTGLEANAPTAWAAVFEVGVPAAVLGTALGLVTGSLIVYLGPRTRQRQH